MNSVLRGSIPCPPLPVHQGREQQNLDIEEENSIMYLIEYMLKYSNWINLWAFYHSVSGLYLSSNLSEMQACIKYLLFVNNTSKIYIIMYSLQVSAKLFSDFCSLLLTFPFSYTCSVSASISRVCPRILWGWLQTEVQLSSWCSLWSWDRSLQTSVSSWVSWRKMPFV